MTSVLTERGVWTLTRTHCMAGRGMYVYTAITEYELNHRTRSEAIFQAVFWMQEMQSKETWCLLSEIPQSHEEADASKHTAGYRC